jgi:uncharacterized protein YqcC (DUF446 family)
MTQRKQRIDSSTAAVRVMASALTELEPPAHVSVPQGARPFWKAIIHARPREDWEAAPALINAAANLAWTQWQIDQMRRMIDGEVDLPEGTAILQIASGLLKMQRLEMGYLRVLQQHGRAVDGEARDVAARRAAAQEIAANNPLANDDLLARPTAH